MTIVDWLSAALGLNLRIQDVGPLQMVLRAAVIYVFTLFAVKLGKRRLPGRMSAFDIVIMIIIGSVNVPVGSGTGRPGISLLCTASVRRCNNQASRLCI